MNQKRLSAQQGALMIEVVVTIAIVVIGVLGLMQMQTRLQKTEMESYQRTQAIILLNDMAQRIATNRAFAPDYVTASALGKTGTCSSITGSNLYDVDSKEWCESLQGAAESVGSDKVGAMIGGQGCVQEVTPIEFRVTVVWQGLTPIAAPPSQVTCGAGDYDEVDTDCVDDLCRRYVTTVVRVAELTI